MNNGRKHESNASHETNTEYFWSVKDKSNLSKDRGIYGIFIFERGREVQFINGGVSISLHYLMWIGAVFNYAILWVSWEMIMSHESMTNVLVKSIYAF